MLEQSAQQVMTRASHARDRSVSCGRTQRARLRAGPTGVDRARDREHVAAPSEFADSSEGQYKRATWRRAASASGALHALTIVTAGVCRERG